MKTVTIQLLGKDDSSFDDSEVLTGRWQAYIESYASVRPFVCMRDSHSDHNHTSQPDGETEGLHTTISHRPFLQRYAPIPSHLSFPPHTLTILPHPPSRTRNLIHPTTLPPALATGALEIRVCVRTYKLFYVAGTEESLERVQPAEAYERAKEALEEGTRRRERWLEGFLGEGVAKPQKEGEGEREKGEKEKEKERQRERSGEKEGGREFWKDEEVQIPEGAPLTRVKGWEEVIIWVEEQQKAAKS